MDVLSVEAARDRASKVFGDRLYEAVGDRRVADVSEATGISEVSIWSYMRGDRNPTMGNIVGLCACLGASADWLLGLEG